MPDVFYGTFDTTAHLRAVKRLSHQFHFRNECKVVRRISGRVPLPRNIAKKKAVSPVVFLAREAAGGGTTPGQGDGCKVEMSGTCCGMTSWDCEVRECKAGDE